MSETKKPPKKKKVDGEAAVLEKIAAMPEPFREMGERLHRIVTTAAPELTPKVWYGMPGYARGGPCVCFFRADEYMSFGLTEKAHLAPDEGAGHQLMPCAWFFSTLDAATEDAIAEIVRKAAG